MFKCWCDGTSRERLKMKMRESIISTKSLGRQKGMVQSPDERMLLPLKQNGCGRKFNNGSREVPVSRLCFSFLCEVGGDVYSREGRRNWESQRC